MNRNQKKKKIEREHPANWEENQDKLGSQGEAQFKELKIQIC